MVTIQEQTYAGMNCYHLGNGQLSIWLTRDFGPRVIGCALAGEDNLMAVLPEARIPVKDGVDYSLRGGHRLWYAPELPRTTYLPDDLPPEIVEIENGLECIQPADAAGIQKSWQIALDPVNAQLTIDHKLTNQGDADFQLAPWAVTMLRPGGVGLIPLPAEKADPHGLWPNRRLVIWPYTDLNSPQLKISNRSLQVRAELEEGALKVGASNPLGWVAYRHQETLFIKRSAYQADAEYLDLGASHQIYCGPEVIELETLGPAVSLGAGKSVDHREIWQLYPEENWPEEIAAYFED